VQIECKIFLINFNIKMKWAVIRYSLYALRAVFTGFAMSVPPVRNVFKSVAEFIPQNAGLRFKTSKQANEVSQTVPRSGTKHPQCGLATPAVWLLR